MPPADPRMFGGSAKGLHELRGLVDDVLTATEWGVDSKDGPVPAGGPGEVTPETGHVIALEPVTSVEVGDRMFVLMIEDNFLVEEHGLRMLTQPSVGQCDLNETYPTKGGERVD